MQTPTIIDIEASGFGSRSYPIEIGVIRSDGARFCRLIRPFSDWTHWEQEAQDLHGLTREHLEVHGQDGREVCLALNAFLSGATVYSDGWVVDHPWLITLYSAAGMKMDFQVRALEFLLTEYQMEHWRSTRQSVADKLHAARHRASTDAEIIQQTFILSQPPQDNVIKHYAMGGR